MAQLLFTANVAIWQHSLPVFATKIIAQSVVKVVRNQQEGGKFFTVGEMYFNLPQLQTRLEQIGRVTKDGEKKLQGGETRVGGTYDVHRMACQVPNQPYLRPHTY